MAYVTYIQCILGFYMTLYISRTYGMECYVCTNQEGNRDKCVKTTMQCLPEQDTCISTIQYKTPDYWTPLGERKHFISKGCTTKSACERQKATFSTRCTREWFMDWSCAECCQGELCNYYVTMSGPKTVMSTMTILAVALLTCIMQFLLH